METVYGSQRELEASRVVGLIKFVLTGGEDQLGKIPRTAGIRAKVQEFLSWKSEALETSQG